MKAFSDQQIEQAEHNIPPAVRDAISGADMAMKIAAIGQAYGLHIDQIGTLARLNRHMLLGLVSPTDFVSGLVESRVSAADAQAIASEVNKQIFLPLRKRMQDAGTRGEEGNEAVPSGAKTTPTPQTRGGEFANANIAAAVPPSPSPSPSATVPAPQPPTPMPEQSVPAPMPAAHAPEPLTTPSAAIEVPLPQQHDTAPLPPRHVLPGATVPQSAIVHPPLPARQAPPPENLPGATPAFIDLHPPVEPAPEPVAPSMPPIPPRPAPPQKAAEVPSAPYSVDPYREPVE